ncbi:hypothetical protein [Gordonia terrae]|uniref:hypothetical protein n=1 Tax=Gordonia terrae TaxID=2055 RepID=UPI003F6B7F34
MARTHRRGGHHASTTTVVRQGDTRSRVATSLTLAAVSIVTIVPTTVAATDSAGVIAGLTGDRPVPASPTMQRVDTAAFLDSPREGAIVLVTPDERNGTLITRKLSLGDDRQSLIVEYPRSIGPVAAGRSHKIELVSPTFDSAKTVAMEKNLSAMMAFGGVGDDRPTVIYTASAQGDEVVVPAVEDAFGGTELAPPPFVVLAEQPQGPWTVRTWMTVLRYLRALAGIETEPVREPPRDVPAPRDPVIVDRGDGTVVVPRDTGGDPTPTTTPPDRSPIVPRDPVPGRGDSSTERPVVDRQSPVGEPVSEPGSDRDDRSDTDGDPDTDARDDPGTSSETRGQEADDTETGTDSSGSDSESSEDSAA